MQVHVCMYIFLWAQRGEIKHCANMSRTSLHPMASLTDSECKRLDAIIRAVGSRLNRQLRKNDEDPDDSDIFECATLLW